ncbi:MAG: hypothetical protein JSV25_02055 [Spirochaetota bacterium]|nr:MAG: hypothetical protein JSV25_02055 [Spirochaetota bacterium]
MLPDGNHPHLGTLSAGSPAATRGGVERIIDRVSVQAGHVLNINAVMSRNIHEENILAMVDSTRAY